MAGKPLFIKLQRDGRSVSSSIVRGKHIFTGRDWKCQLVDPASSESRKKLISRTLGSYRISLPLDASGTFDYQGSTIALDDMVAWKLARKTRKGYQIHHRDGMSGEIHIGSATYVLSYDDPGRDPGVSPAAVQQGTLPLRYRFQPLNRTDLTFLTLLTLILLVHIAGVRSLRNYPIPEITAIKELPRRISRLILEPAAPLPAQVARKGEASGESEEPAPEEKTKPEPEPEKAPLVSETAAKGESPAPVTRDVIRSQVSKMGVVGVLTGRGTAGRKTAGAGISVLQLDSELQQDLESVLGEISGITASASVSGTGGDAGFGGAGPGTGLIGIEGQLDDANVSGPIQVSTLGTAGGQPLGVLDGSAADGAAGADEDEYIAPEQREERSARTIARVIAANTGKIRYAYNRELRKKPSLRGKIVLTFTISPQGVVTECHVEESAMNWPPLENSLVKMVKKFRFPEIPKGDVTVSYPLVFFPSM